MEKNIDNRTWQDNTLLIKSFIEQRLDYEQLCIEVAYILSSAIQKDEVEYSAITQRAKTLKSFLEKITRKSYKDPLKEISDFAGVRLVFLYNSDFKIIEQIINSTFKVIEKVDKLEDKGVDKFGYGAIHYIVKLSKKHSGARYDNLKNLKCEIQVRTVLQDAWSIIDHHLVYKNESAIPKQLRRKLNSLAGLFETADDQFNQIRSDREAYIEEVKNSTLRPQKFLETDLNIDSFREYLKYKFSAKQLESFESQLDICYEIVSDSGNYKKLKDIDVKINEVEYRFEDIERVFAINSFAQSSSAFLIIALAIKDSDIINHILFAEDWKDFIFHNLSG